MLLEGVVVPQLPRNSRKQDAAPEATQLLSDGDLAVGFVLERIWPGAVREQVLHVGATSTTLVHRHGIRVNDFRYILIQKMV